MSLGFVPIGHVMHSDRLMSLPFAGNGIEVYRVHCVYTELLVHSLPEPQPFLLFNRVSRAVSQQRQSSPAAVLHPTLLVVVCVAACLPH